MKNIFIVVPAYNVSKLIKTVFDRIPQSIYNKTSQIVIINDSSKDNTLEVIRSLKIKYPKIYILDKKQNEGYAKAQKSGFTYALNKGADIVILLHGDGQYAPEELPRLVKPLEEGVSDLVQGSRILGGKALQGKMPLYKFIANRVLSTIENWVFGMRMAEYHSGYMLYSKKALTKIPFMKLSDTFHFDGEMLFMANKKGLRIKELPIPTTYAGETSNLSPIKYGFDVLKIIWDYKTGKYNF